jgi:hypothetical protein
MPQWRVKDLERSRQIGVILDATFCGFYEPDDDIEVAFAPQDGRVILGLIQRFLNAQVNTNTPDFLLHRFKNLDDVGVPDYENSAFRIREHEGGIEFTVDNCLKSGDDVSDGEISGMSICISREDAQRMANGFALEVDATASSAGASDEHPIKQ